MTYYLYDDENSLSHYGVLGMKWGIRRFKNYDGTYTQKGVSHYKKAEGRYDRLRSDYKKTRKAYKSGAVTKIDLNRSKSAVKDAKREMNRAYKQVKRDKLADQGKELYRNGKTITGNGAAVKTIATLGTAAAYAAYHFAPGTITLKTPVRDIKTRNYTAIALGTAAVTSILRGKNAVQDRKLRAYYSHTRSYTYNHKD